MRIVRAGAGTPAERGRKAGKSARPSDAEAFRKHISEDGASATAGPAGSGPLAALGSLLAVQEVPDATSGRRRAARHGDMLLDELKELQIGLVQGWVPEDTLRSLAHMLDRPRPTIDDPDLEMVLDEIELRAAVELAKFDRERSG